MNHHGEAVSARADAHEMPPFAATGADSGLVLVVADASRSTMELMQALRLEGCTTLRAEDGPTAMEQWRSGCCAMVIVDVNMKVLDGYAFARHVRSREAADGGDARVPIVAWSTNPFSEEAEICVASGVDDYLAKPLLPGNLARKIDKWLRGESERPDTDAGGFTLTGPAPL